MGGILTRVGTFLFAAPIILWVLITVYGYVQYGCIPNGFFECVRSGPIESHNNLLSTVISYTTLPGLLLYLSGRYIVKQR
jgi:hypothetical protein